MEGGDRQWNSTSIFLHLQDMATSDNVLREECVATGIRIYLVTETTGRKFIFI